MPDLTTLSMQELIDRIHELEVENAALRKELHDTTPAHTHQRRQLLKAIDWFINKYGCYPAYDDVFEIIPSRTKSALRMAIDSAADRRELTLINPIFEDTSVVKGQRKVVTNSTRHIPREKRPANMWRYTYEMRNEFDKLKAKWKNRRKRCEKLGIEPDDPISVMYRNQGGKCWWCGCELDGKYVLDHRVALVRRGNNDVGNLCVSCYPCNKKKGYKTPHKFNGRLL